MRPGTEKSGGQGIPMKKLPPTDTRPEAQRVLVEIYRRMSATEKLRCLAGMKNRAKILHAAGYRLRHPSATESEIADDWLLLTLGKALTHAIMERRRDR